MSKRQDIIKMGYFETNFSFGSRFQHADMSEKCKNSNSLP